MSKNRRDTIEQLKTEELVDFALEHLGPEHTDLRQAALQEYLSRVKNDPNTVVAPAEDDKLLELKLSQLMQSSS
jgi:hypothetical protein